MFEMGMKKYSFVYRVTVTIHFKPLLPIRTPPPPLSKRAPPSSVFLQYKPQLHPVHLYISKSYIPIYIRLIRRASYVVSFLIWK